MIETKREALARWKRERRAGKVAADRKRWMEELFASGMTKAKAES